MMANVARVAAAAPQGARGMATISQLALKLASVKSITKITSSMKMVSAAKFARAEKALRAVRSMGPASTALVQKSGIEIDNEAEQQLTVMISSDRGLCGAIHSGVAKHVKAVDAAFPDNVTHKMVSVGDKTRGLMARTHGDQILLAANEFGRLPPTFSEASLVASQVLGSGFEFTNGRLVYNHFRNAASYECREIPLVNAKTFEGKAELDEYDGGCETEVIESYCEFSMASNIFYGMLEQQSSEQSARMTAMENATNNANDQIESLQILYNRTRQAKITTELIEIISGAAALDG